VGNNLKFWPNEVEIIGQTLDLFLDMSQGYSSSKLLLTLDSVKVSERSERVLRKTSILTMNSAKWLQTATSATELTHPISFDSLVLLVLH